MEAVARTAAALLPSLIGPDAEPLDLRFTGPDGTPHPTSHVIMVSNNPYQLRMIGGRGTRERLDQGTLGVVAIHIAGAAEFSRLVALDMTGRADRFPGWLEWTTSAFRIDSDGPVEIGVDGEALVLDPPLLFETLPGALRVRLPRHAIGRSPAAIATHLASRSTILQLVRLACGRADEEDSVR